MIASVAVFALLSTILANQVETATVIDKRVAQARGNSITDPRHPQDANCCIVPSCNEYNECYDSVECGYICSQGLYKPINYGSTPGFRLKESFKKIDCHFGFCQNYIFLCKHCPDPREEDFNIYTVRRDCRNCYYNS